MTIAERLEQGEEKAIQKTTYNMLKEGCNIGLIARVTGLTDDQLVILKAKL